MGCLSEKGNNTPTYNILIKLKNVKQRFRNLPEQNVKLFGFPNKPHLLKHLSVKSNHWFKNIIIIIIIIIIVIIIITDIVIITITIIVIIIIIIAIINPIVIIIVISSMSLSLKLDLPHSVVLPPPLPHILFSEDRKSCDQRTLLVAMGQTE